MKAKKTGRPGPLPDDLSVDGVKGWQNWNFDGVGPEEEIACCWWEYARESGYFRMLRQRFVKAWRATVGKELPCGSESDELLEIQIPDRMVTAFVQTFLGDPPIDWWQRNHLSKNNPVTGSFPMPWQSLSVSERKFLAQVPTPSANWFKGFRSLHWTHARQILRHAPERCINADGAELFVAEIRWGFRPDEIKWAFNQWVDHEIPKLYRRPKGRPRGWLNHAAALRCLAIMRVLRDHSAYEVYRKFPALWHKNPKYGRDHKKALEIFYQLFPLLKAELPLSWRENIDK